MRNGCSDRLYNAETGSLDPEEVFSLIEGEVIEELGPTSGDVELDAYAEADTKRITSAVQVARSLYAGQGEESFARMCAHEEEWVRMIGEALSSGIYDGLAI